MGNRLSNLVGDRPCRAVVRIAVGVLMLASARAADRDAVAIDAEIQEALGHATLTLRLSAPIVPVVHVMERPDRVVIELPGVNCQTGSKDAGRRGAIVVGYRCGAAGIGRSRAVMELATPALPVRTAITEAPTHGYYVFELELARAERAGFQAAAKPSPGRDPAVTGSVTTASAADRRPLVVIDAGHGGVDPGARSAAGDNEKDIVLAFAQTLRTRLLAGGAVRVLMTRDQDVFVPLDDRVRIARSAGAQLFVSIHADSITAPAVRGATVYTGAERATDLESARLAERENSADAAGGLPPAAISGVSDILQDLTVRETRTFSQRFAKLLLADLGRVTRFTAQPHREAGFRVLRAADMTSCLVELGYVSSPSDSDLLTSDEWRTRTAAAMAEAIERFVSPRTAERAPVSP